MFLKIGQLFCKHDYVADKNNFIEQGLPRILVWKCSKCGHEKSKVIG